MRKNILTARLVLWRRSIFAKANGIIYFAHFAAAFIRAFNIAYYEQHTPLLAARLLFLKYRRSYRFFSFLELFQNIRQPVNVFYAVYQNAAHSQFHRHAQIYVEAVADR